MRIFILVMISIAVSASAQTFRVDGVFDEWGPLPPVASDPAGDNSGAFDITTVSAAVKGTVLYIDWDTNAPVNLQAGNGSDGTIRIELAFSSGDTLTVDLRARLAYENGNPGNGVSWHDIDYTTLPTTASDRYETQIDLTDYVTGPGDTFTLDFYGSDSLAAPVQLAVNNTPQPEIEHPHAPENGTVFRVFNMNTLSTGLSHSSRGPRVQRLIDAFDPDIICLQEEYNSSESSIASILNSVDPLDDGSSWNVQKFDDCAVASVHQLIPVPTTSDDEFAAAVIVLDASNYIFVASVHPKCCGFVGSSEDNQRVDEMTVLADRIEDFRAGTLGGSLAPYSDAPVVVTGDWNLVGSTAPLDLMTDPAGPGLTHLIVPHLVGERATTWRDFDGFGFSPGMLDITAYDEGSIDALNNFVIDTERMSGGTLASLGLQSDDSTASDHWACVVDFGSAVTGPCSPADITTAGAGVGDPGFGVPDGQITSADLNFFVNAWVALDVWVADVTTTGAGAGDPGFGVPDGQVTAADLQYFVNLWIAGCP